MQPTKIDIYNHVMPLAYLDLVKQHGKEPSMVRHVSNLHIVVRNNSIRTLWRA